MTQVSRTVIAPPTGASKASPVTSVFDMDIDAEGHSLLATGIGQTASHLLFPSGASVRLPVPLFSCRARQLDPDTALVWGTRRLSREEPAAWVVKSTGAHHETFAAIQYCADVFGTDNHLVLTYSDDHMGIGNAVADEGLAVFDRSGAFLWGWNSTIREAASITDCDEAVWLGADLVGVFASDEFPLVVLDLATRRPVAIHHPMPRVLHGAHAISMRDGVWYFVGSYEAKEAILAWRPQRGSPEVVGHVPSSRRLRGLPRGRFVSIDSEHAEILALT